MRANFKIKNFREIQYNSREIDVHNNFDFQGFDFRVTDATLIFYWTKSVEDWARHEVFDKITLLHNGVTYFKVKPMDPNNDPGDDKCLSEITFFPSTERHNDESFLDQEDPMDSDDIIYSFVSGQVIRVGCDEVVLECN